MKSLTVLCFFLCWAVYSPAQQAEKTGILVLAHGGSQTWQDAVHEAVKPLEAKYPVALAFGMADPLPLQQGLNTLKKQSVTNVIVVPLFISSYSPIIRQTEYLLGLRKELADEPMMNHIHGHGKEHSNHASHSDENNNNVESSHKSDAHLEPLKFQQKVIMTRALDDNPLVAEILCDRVLDLSKQSEHETVILVAHGPNGESDNQRWVQTMEGLSDQMRSLFSEKGKKYNNTFSLTVRDDADTSIYAQAKEHLRSVVRQAGKDGRVLVVPLFLSYGGVERDIVTRLEGLTYEWSGKTLLPHPNITKFIELSISEALKNTLK